MSLSDNKDMLFDNDPFPHCVIRNFLQQNGSVNELQNSVLKLDYLEKSNDLYKFKQVGTIFFSTNKVLIDFTCTVLVFNLFYIHTKAVHAVCGLLVSKIICILLLDEGFGEKERAYYKEFPRDSWRRWKMAVKSVPCAAIR